jgi:hypothetical protein
MDCKLRDQVQVLQMTHMFNVIGIVRTGDLVAKDEVDAARRGSLLSTPIHFTVTYLTTVYINYYLELHHYSYI